MTFTPQDWLRELKAPLPPGDVSSRQSIIYAFPPALTGEIDLLSETVKLMLLTSKYMPDKAHTRRSDIPPEAEVVGQGYTAGGNIVRVAAGGKIADQRWICLGGAEWPKSKIGVTTALYYADRGSAAEDRLIMASVCGYIGSIGGTWAFTGAALLVPTTPRPAAASTGRARRAAGRAAIGQ